MSDANYPGLWLRLTLSLWRISSLGKSGNEELPEARRRSCAASAGENKTHPRVVYFPRTIKSWQKDIREDSNTHGLAQPPLNKHNQENRCLKSTQISLIKQEQSADTTLIFMCGCVTEPRGECITQCQGWMDGPALTHSALQPDHTLTPCRSEREKQSPWNIRYSWREFDGARTAMWQMERALPVCVWPLL